MKTLTLTDKKKLIDKADSLSINKQCKILGLSKGSLYYKPDYPYSQKELAILNRMDELYTDYPFYGYRKMYHQLKREGFIVGRDKILKYMKVLGLESLCPRAKIGLSIPNKEHKIYPYLLNDIEICLANQVWAIDITYIRLTGGFAYLVAIIDWYSKYILSYRVSNSLELSFCKESPEEALWLFSPDILTLIRTVSLRVPTFAISY